MMKNRATNFITYIFHKPKFLRSLRLRLFIIIALVGLIPGSVLWLSILNSYVDYSLNQRTKHVAEQIRMVSNQLVSSRYLYDSSSQDSANAQLNMLAGVYDGRVLVVGSNYKIKRDTFGISEGKYLITPEVISCFKGQELIKLNKNSKHSEVYIPILGTLMEKNAVPDGVIVMSMSTSNVIQTEQYLQKQAAIIEFSIMILVICIAIFLSFILLRPFKTVTDSIASVTADYGVEAAPVPVYTETEHIINAFNDVRRRMKVIDDSRNDFVSDVSHELKTPLASMKVLADSLVADQSEIAVEIYKEFMIDIVHEIDRENKIVNDLLSLVKLEKKAANLNIETVDINAMIEIVLKNVKGIASVKNVTITYESLRPVEAQIDEVKLSLALTNLVENAIKYNKEGGWVNVSLDADHQFFTVEVSDSGVGIPEAELDKIYERFYRVDKSRSQEIEGTGLGLAITRRAVLLHRGSIKVTSVEGEGATFLLKVPLIFATK